MNKYEFLGRLSELLSDISMTEKEEAIKYYRDYFEEAGIENEQNVIKELVSPENVAETIKRSLGDDSFYEECEYNSDSLSKAGAELLGSAPEKKDNADSGNYQYGGAKTEDSSNKKMSTGTIVAIVIACVLLSPVIFSAISSVVSLITTFIVLIILITIVIAVLPFVLSIGGLITIVVGIVKLAADAAIGVLICGSGLIALGAGLISFAVFWLYFFKLMPAFFKWFSSIGTKKGGAD